VSIGMDGGLQGAVGVLSADGTLLALDEVPTLTCAPVAAHVRHTISPPSWPSSCPTASHTAIKHPRRAPGIWHRGLALWSLLSGLLYRSFSSIVLIFGGCMRRYAPQVFIKARKVVMFWATGLPAAPLQPAQ
jgi:hypothetical protein